ncbi:MAG: YheC/YheD family protein [Myxococcota bacterium]
MSQLLPTVGVLVPTYPGTPTPPAERPVGRAALQLREEGVSVLFGDQVFRRDGQIWMSGLAALPDRWEPAERPIAALHDRFPSQRRAAQYRAVLAQLDGLPMGNPESLTLLCRDKAACQRYLEQSAPTLPMPALVTNPDVFEDHLSAWKAGFLKPQYGALGVSVQRVHPGDPLPRMLPGVVEGIEEPTILQRAVAPPPGWAGRSARVLCQREPDRRWHQCEPAVRESRDDYVVNAARGATVRPGSQALSPDAADALHTICQQTLDALAQHPDGDLLVEVGLDVVFDAAEQPWLIEVNSRPRGRLEVLAARDPARFAQAHRDACARPLRALAHWVRDLSI